MQTLTHQVEHTNFMQSHNSRAKQENQLMAQYRDRTTGDIKTQGQLRKENPNMSLPRVWGDNVHDALNVDVIIETNAPYVDPRTSQMAVQGPLQQAEDGSWKTTWNIVDMFQEYTDEEGVVHSKADQEAAHLAYIDNGKAETQRFERDRLLAETDWWAMSDTADMTAEQTAYRQALRDISSHVNWPYLEEADWPTKP